MSSVVALAGTAPADLLESFAGHDHLLGGKPDYRRDRVAAARAFLRDHPDLEDWMSRPVDERLVELRRRPLAWPLVGFAILSGRVRADAEFLFAKNFGHSMARWTAGLFPVDVRRLADAGRRAAVPGPEDLLRQALPLAVAFSGHPPAALTLDDLDALAGAVAATTRLTESMRRTW